MNYEQALIGQPYAKRVNDVLERLEVECICTRTKYRGAPGPLYCPVCNNTKKIKWSWSPQVGEWYYQCGKLHLVTDPLVAIERIKHEWNKTGAKAISILEWEMIERVLEKAGLALSVLKYEGYVKCYIHRGDELLVTEQRKDRLSAVYYAVLALGKEIK